MLDVTTTDTESITTTKFTEAQARAHLAQIHGPRPPIRKLAEVFGWKVATTGRFIQAYEAETKPETAVRQPECPTPYERRQMLINGTKEFDEKFPPESAEAAVDRSLAEGKIPKSQADRVADGEGDWVWSIPSQIAIDCAAVADGGVEITQDGQHGPDEAATIHVAAGNVVRLARSILYAAGFNSIGIYTHERAGNVDIEDGQLASNFQDGRQ
jgi:hypothetical protein